MKKNAKAEENQTMKKWKLKNRECGKKREKANSDKEGK